MKKAFISIIVLLIIVVGYFYFRQSNSSIGIGCVIEENKGELVSVNTAQTFAQKQVTANNKPYGWTTVGYYPIYSSSDVINYYAFVFRKADYTKFTTLSSLEQNASNYSNKSSDDDNKYQFNDIASVWTGASNGQKILMRHYRGIPEIMAEKIKLRNLIEDKYKDKTIGNIIADSEGGPVYFDIIDRTNNKSTGDVIRSDYSIISKKELVDNQKEVENRRYANLNGSECEKIRQAIAERAADFMRQWNEVAN